MALVSFYNYYWLPTGIGIIPSVGSDPQSSLCSQAVQGYYQLTMVLFWGIMTGPSGQNFLVIVSNEGCDILPLSPEEWWRLQTAVLAHIQEIIHRDYP